VTYFVVGLVLGTPFGYLVASLMWIGAVDEIVDEMLEERMAGWSGPPRCPECGGEMLRVDEATDSWFCAANHRAIYTEAERR